MRALHWDGAELELRREHPDPQPPDGRALVRVRMAGVCSTDLQILKGYMDYRGVLGHEFVGEVLEGPDDLRGHRVTGEINFACGACPSCGRGLGRHCPRRTVLGILGAPGCFSDLVAVPVENLHRVPDALTDEQAAFAEPLAAAFEVLEQVHVAPGSRALVLGDGKLGLLVAQVLRQAGARVTVVGKHADKLERARRVGLHTRDLEAHRGRSPEGADVVVEVTGSEQGLQLAMEAVRPRGTLVLKSTVAARHALSLAPLVIDEVTVVGSRCGPFPPALQALAEGTVRTEPLLAGVHSLDDGLAAVERARTAGTLKVLLQADGRG